MTLTSRDRNAMPTTAPTSAYDPALCDSAVAGGGRAFWHAVLVVVLTAIGINTFCLAASRLWVYPDSIDYIVLAGGIAGRADFANGLFLIRPPGYPVLLALVFSMFGSASPFAVLALQHLMAAATALLTAAIAWTITRRATHAALAGILCACGLQALAYANLVLTETTYTFLMTACLFALLHYIRNGRAGSLVAGSMLAGLAYLVKPIGVYLLGVCVLAVVLFVWRSRRGARHAANTARAMGSDRNVGRATHFGTALSASYLNKKRVAGYVALSILPALLVIAPWKITTAALHGSDDTNRCLDYVLYLRALEFDGLDAPDSSALQEIKQTVAEAIQRESLPHGADFRDRATVIRAYEEVRGMPFAESSAVMGRAARDVMRDNITAIGVNTVKYAAWMLLTPDPVYRFQPGGTAGIGGKRNPDAIIYDAGTYAFGPGSWEPTLSKYRHYLPLDGRPRPASAAWTGLARVFHDRVDAAPPVIGIADSPYSEWIVFSLVGALLTLSTRERTLWFLLLTTLALHVLISAFLSGPQTRYVLPIQPILKLGGAWFAIEIVRCTVLALRAINPKTERRRAASTTN